jgi:hypothetical protein
MKGNKYEMEDEFLAQSVEDETTDKKKWHEDDDEDEDSEKDDWGEGDYDWSNNEEDD